MTKAEIILFQQNKIRRVYDKQKGLWYFSIIDIIAVLTESALPKRY